ncbi:MAG: ComEC/Rec2 family competence protein [Bacilli bacterium]
MKKIKKLIISIFLVISILTYNYVTNKENIQNDLKASINIENSDFEIRFIDVGQADSILIKSNKEYMLIDAGNNNDGENLVKYFKDLNIKEFKYVVGTHAHEDHIGGMDNIINSFKVNTFYMPDVITTTKTFEDVLDSLQNKNLKFETPKIGQKFYLGETLIEVIYVGTDEKDLNNTSIVLKANYKDTKVLLMGDATKKTENEIINKNLNSNVIKIGHHGSSYSSNQVFINKVNPQISIISVGKNNIYNHPNNETLETLKNSKIYRTDLNGTIILKSDGKNIEIESEK